MTDLVWTTHWEADLSTDDQRALATALARIYPAHAATFADGHSWSGARPEVRVVAWDGARPVAHLGFIRRTLRIEGSSAGLLLGDVGLVGVDPDHQRQGIGARLLAEAREALAALELPFGFLTCRPAVVPFYERGGWVAVADQVTRMIDDTGAPERYTGPALVLPVLAPIADWPVGVLVRDGFEV